MQDDLIPIVIVGAHLSGMPLNHELTALGARLLRSDETLPVYRLYELPGTRPSKPGLLRVAEGGVAVSVEVWEMSAEAFGRFVSRIPAPLSIGKVLLAGGEPVSGFLAEAVGVREARDISSYGGWRRFREDARVA